jgi:hypothetical protein
MYQNMGFNLFLVIDQINVLASILRRKKNIFI